MNSIIKYSVDEELARKSVYSRRCSSVPVTKRSSVQITVDDLAKLPHWGRWCQVVTSQELGPLLSAIWPSLSNFTLLWWSFSHPFHFPLKTGGAFLVIGDELNTKNGPPAGRDVDFLGLQQILSSKINEGYAFQLNPKWVLCDPGWKAIYDALMASNASHVQDSFNCWVSPRFWNSWTYRIDNEALHILAQRGGDHRITSFFEGSYRNFKTLYDYKWTK